MYVLSHLMIPTYVQCMYVPAFGQFQHCPGEANDTPDNSKQHCSKDNRLLATDSPSQSFVLKQTGATYIK